MKLINFFIFLLIASSLSSCIEEIDLILKEQDQEQLVVEGMITTDTTAHIVKLSKTAPYFSQKPAERASGADVTITDDFGNVFQLEEYDPGIYKTGTDVYGIIGRTYNLNIKFGGETYSAQSTMKRVPVIDSLGYVWNPQREQYIILLYGQEPEGKGDNYMWHVYKNGQHVTDTIDKVLFIDDELFDGAYIMGFKIEHWIYDYNIQKGDTVRVDTHSIPHDALLFFTGVLNESHYSWSPIDTPPANIKGNISNEAIGLFFASGISRNTVIIE